MRAHGRFCWYELSTLDIEAAKAFYTDVMGWTTSAWGDPAEPYTMWSRGTESFGGLMTVPEQARAMGAPPHWMGYVAVDDADATVAKAQGLGATVYVPPMDIPNVGRFAVFADPQRATIAILQPSDPSEGPAPGAVAWHELATGDVEAALAFYGAIFGWQKIDTMDMGPAGLYHLVGLGGAAFGGAFKKPAEMPMPPCWIYYLTLTDLEGAITRAQARGAKLMLGPEAVPGGDRIAQLVDPQGAFFALHTKAAA